MDPELIADVRKITGAQVTAADVRRAFAQVDADTAQASKVPCPVCGQPGSIYLVDARGPFYRHPGRNFPCREIPTTAVAPVPVSREAQWLS